VLLRIGVTQPSGVLIIINEIVYYINVSTLEDDSRNNQCTESFVLQSPIHTVVIVVHTSLKIEKPVKGMRDLLGM